MLKQLSHMLCLFFPCSVLLFLGSGPHDITGALIWTVPLWVLVIADWLSPKVKPQPASKGLNLYFDGLLYGLALIQLLNIGLMLNYVTLLQWDSLNETVTGLVNLVVVRIMVGTSSGCSGLIVAHELIHRSQSHMQYLGRLLLCTVCDEHFSIAHKRGHHRNIGKPHDIATARLGESFDSYWKRVYMEHLRYAWHSEQVRLGIPRKSYLCLKTIRNRVVHGILFEILLIASMVYFFGWIAALLFLYQAFAALRLLETINYFQHWGLEADQKPHPIAWVNDSWITRHALLSLSYHIDHHNNASRHYQTLCYSNQGPKMPYGYFVMNLWVKLNNASYQKMAKFELEKYANKPLSELAYPVEADMQATEI